MGSKKHPLQNRTNVQIKGGGSKAFWTMFKKTALFLGVGFPKASTGWFWYLRYPREGTCPDQVHPDPTDGWMISWPAQSGACERAHRWSMQMVSLTTICQNLFGDSVFLNLIWQIVLLWDEQACQNLFGDIYILHTDLKVEECVLLVNNYIELQQKRDREKEVD